MGPFDYVVVKLYGDYADLKRTDIESDELLMIARALLPDDVEEGTKLHYEAIREYGPSPIHRMSFLRKMH